MPDLTGLGSIAQAAASIAGKFFPDKTEVEKAVIAEQMQQEMNAFKLQSAQTDINLEEAKSTNWFVAGWRPFIGWVCGTGLAYQFIFMPIANGLAASFGHLGVFVSLDSNTLVSCLSGLLGNHADGSSRARKNAAMNIQTQYQAFAQNQLERKVTIANDALVKETQDHATTKMELQRERILPKYDTNVKQEKTST